LDSEKWQILIAEIEENFKIAFQKLHIEAISNRSFQQWMFEACLYENFGL
jgi:hypothetical protein